MAGRPPSPASGEGVGTRAGTPDRRGVPLRVMEVDPTGRDARSLLREAAVEARSLYPELFEPGEPWPTNEPTPPRGIYLVAYERETPVASGALRPLDEAHAEVRRMFVTRSARRKGAASEILRELEARALRLGYSALRLETGYKQRPAIALYESHGYRRIPPFGDYAHDPTSVCFEKTLDVPPQLVLLPGLDGTGELFRWFVSEAPSWAGMHPVTLPSARYGTYPALADDVADVVTHLPSSRAPVILLAESFSGPLALDVASRLQSRCRGVVLCASFVTSPIPLPARLVPWRAALALPPPRWAVRRYLVGDAADSVVEAVREAIAKPGPRLLSSRMRLLAKLDHRETLRRLPQPVGYLRPRGDRLVGGDAAAAVLAARKDTLLEEVEGPHLLLQSRPRAAWVGLERVLRRMGLWRASSGGPTHVDRARPTPPEAGPTARGRASGRPP